MITTAIPTVRSPIDTLVVAGGNGTRRAVLDADLVHHVGRLAGGARRVTSVCTGSFLLAQAGLLEGCRVTTHWEWCETLASTYPALSVEPDAIFVQDGRVWTSAGVTAGIDLALALVAVDHGQQAAATVARQLVVYLRRSGGQFNRVFTAGVGVTPARHVEAIRVEAACRLLDTTSRPVGDVARVSGFGTPETMHRAFRRRLATTPGDYRRHFTIHDPEHTPRRRTPFTVT